ncbi:MAG: RNA methyltransferase [Gammaproteobacteria bacterium]|nr:RNA methyltransferase [Gammaproteobacteria bacterium]
MTKNNNQQLLHESHTNSNLKFPLCLLLDDFENPLNVGSIFRISDALGVTELYLCGSTPVPPNKKITKTSRSTEKSMTYHYVKSAEQTLTQLKADHYTIIALEITTQSLDLVTLKYSNYEKICLIAGSEKQGIKPSLLRLSNNSIHIPMLGINSSMNVATACAIAVFEITRGYKKKNINANDTR